jgi:mitotic spindle assembly checkpoint protein MAD2
MAATSTDTAITLKGSVQIVQEFFGYAINSILYQRGIYPPDTFAKNPKYGLTMMVTTDEALTTYLSNVLVQLEGWMTQGDVQRLVLVIEGIESSATLERWDFKIEQEVEVASVEQGPRPTKSKKKIQGEIQAIIRQITASVTFLPILDEPCAFDLLVYTSADAAVPKTWEDSDPRYINPDQCESVRLRSFTTSVHKVDTCVMYKGGAMEDDEC